MRAEPTLAGQRQGSGGGAERERFEIVCESMRQDRQRSFQPQPPAGTMRKLF